MSRKQKRMLKRIVLAAVLFVAALLLPVDGWLRFAIFMPAYLMVGYDVLIKAGKNILNGRLFDENFLMALATIGALVIKEYPEAVAVMLFYQIGELFQSVAVGKSRKSIAALMDIKPDFANVYKEGQLVEVFPEEVNIGDIILVKPGEKVPLDGVVVEGSTMVNTVAITGESVPVEKCEGQLLVSGCVNMTGAVKIKVNSLYKDSTVAKILELVENSYEKKSKADAFITRFARYYTPFVVFMAIALVVLGPIITNSSLSMWIERALIFLVVSCPCALVISVPLSFFAGIGCGAKEGILIKGSNYLESLAAIDTMVMDKTGTLTKGNFKVSKISVISGENYNKEDILYYAAMVEYYSNHPIAKAITTEYGKDIDEGRIENVKEHSGFGIEAIVDKKHICAGNERFMKKLNLKVEDLDKSGSIVYIAIDGKYEGYILVEDEIKNESKKAIAMLKKLSINSIVILTGDKYPVAKNVADALGITTFYAELLPANKVEKVEEMLKNNKKVAFVGDGINDAPVLARADIGIAMGAMGSDAAIEAADIVLMDDNPIKLATAIKISKKTMNIVRQNIIFALGIKAVVMILGALGIANMWLAVFADVGVMVIAILNAMRTFKI